MGIGNILIAIAIFLVLWRVSVWAVRLLMTPPPVVDPEETIEVEQRYLCTLCGTEVVMTIRNLVESAPPKHCREEMVGITGV